MELTIDAALQKAIEAHKADQIEDADRLYTAILKAQPQHPDANHNMGLLAVGVGKVDAALPFFKTALEANPNITQFWLSYIDALVKLDKLEDAKAVLDQAKSKGANGEKFEQIEKTLARLEKATEIKAAFRMSEEPSQKQVQPLINLHMRGHYRESLDRAFQLLKQFPNSITLYNIIGASNRRLGNLDKAVDSYKKAISIKPDYADAFNNMGNVLKEKGKLEQAIEAFNKAISIEPNYAEAYSNLGNTLQAQDKQEEAITACNTSLLINPDNAEAYNIMGNALKDQGKLEEAIEAYTKTLSIKPDYAEAYNNMGNVLKEQGNLDEAIQAYTKALEIKPDLADVHHNLSWIKTYTEDDKHFLQVKELFKRSDLSEDEKCHFSFALAKMYEDIGTLDQSFAHLSNGNALRKKLLNYSIKQDHELFTKLKNAQPHLLKNSLEIIGQLAEATPIFILGMPRSGTTLLEQIISSHPEVTGAGELNYLALYGGNIGTNFKSEETASLSVFRGKYLSELSKLSNGKKFITDKMPQNFRFVPLICAALPEAKIIHVQRNPGAICWSNYKQYFVSNSLGYCYDLKDVVEYYRLYKELMNLWQSQYVDRIYNLNYEKLTTDQENQTRKLINYLGLNWEEACLSPQKNKRIVRTASQQQVRQKVYTGSSEAWRKYEPYLNGAFDSLKST